MNSRNLPGLLDWLEAAVVLLAHLAQAAQMESDKLRLEQLRVAGFELAEAVHVTDGQTAESTDWPRLLALLEAWEAKHAFVVALLRAEGFSADASVQRLRELLA